MPNNRSVYKKADGFWINKRNGAEKAAGVHKTQEEAIKEAKEMLRKSGGGELITMGLNGKIRSKDTIPPAEDPNPPLDTEH